MRVDNRTLFIRALYAAKIIYIHHYFDEIGNLLSVQNFQLKYGLNIICSTYYSIISTIPQRWKVEIKEHHRILDALFVQICRKRTIYMYVKQFIATLHNAHVVGQ